MRIVARYSVVMIAAALVTACGGGGGASGGQGTPAPTLTAIAVTPVHPSVVLGNTQQFIATGTYSDSTSTVLTTRATWTSSDTAIATMSTATGQEGRASSVAAGTVTVSAVYGGVTGTTLFTITSPLPIPVFGGVLTVAPNVLPNGASGQVTFSLPSLAAGTAASVEMTVTPAGGSSTALTKSGGGAFTAPDLGTMATVNTPVTVATDASKVYTYSLTAANANGSSSTPATATLQMLRAKTDLTGGIQRVGASATLLPDGRVLIAGGGRKSTNAVCSTVTNTSKTVELYDPATGSSSVLGGSASAANQLLSIERCSHTAVLVGTKVYFFGGANTTSVDVYDTTNDTFLTSGLPALNTARLQPTATLLGGASGTNSGKIVVAGGYAPVTGASLASIELFTPNGASSTSTTYAAQLGGGTAGSGRGDHTATLVGKWLFFVGGIYGTGAGASSSVDAIDTTLAATGGGAATVVNSTPSSNATVRWGHAAAALSSGNHILLLGGFDGSSTLLNSVQAYAVNTTTGSAAAAATANVAMASGRAYFPALLTRRADIFLVPGGTSILGTTDTGSTNLEMIDSRNTAAIAASSYSFYGSTALRVARQHAATVTLNLAGSSNLVFLIAGGDPGGTTAANGTAEVVVDP